MEVTEFREPFRHWIIEHFIDGGQVDLTAALTGIPWKGWSGWIQYDNACETHKRTAEQFDRPGVTNLLRALAHSAPFVSELTGIPDLEPTLCGGGIHITDPGGRLNCHLDYAVCPRQPDRERRVNLILFLNLTWPHQAGGSFELYADDARQCMKRIAPKFNRAVIWEASDLSYHGTEQTTQDAPARITAACYFHAPARPGVTRKRALFVPPR